MSYVETFYRPGAAADRPRPALAGRLEVEVAVVGGGLSGLTTALELARRGRSVAVLEAQRVAWGASGRNGGFVSPGWACGYGTIRRAVGEAAAKELHRLSMEGVRIVAGNLQALAVPDADPVPGILSAVRYEATQELKKQRDWLEREFNYRTEFKTREELAELVSSPCYHQALYNSNGFHFHPLNYARALAREIERLGGRIFEGSPVVALETDRPDKLVRTQGGEIHARHVVLASGGYTGGLVPALARSFLPIATYVMLTRPAPELIATAIRTRAGIADDRRAGDYYRLVDGGQRILWGGKITTRTSEPRRLAELLRKTMVATYPQLKDLPVDIAWSGLMSYARHLMPQVGRLKDGVWHCTAFGGHGLNTTAIGGLVIAEAIAGESDRYRQFAPFGLVWNGGIAGRLAAQLTYWSYQAADFFRERRSA
ncbi:NAD(P)/FAD-dependent oxidoreductase [Geminicoccus roseus]|uniref:NAD(P)/FAD-dependent oxidoreductase n=1 Tax=Geminicoccus roseus TaxID=404900 RepID=UPI00041EFE9C|nr:FAD-binding oxidoreductase [Geminicoccus roseus]